ncbi:MAG: hypothetical protein AVDCRST_MAG79-479, partial [uncultured Thermoleophilia bacterium]
GHRRRRPGPPHVRRGDGEAVLRRLARLRRRLGRRAARRAGLPPGLARRGGAPPVVASRRRDAGERGAHRGARPRGAARRAPGSSVPVLQPGARTAPRRTRAAGDRSVVEPPALLRARPVRRPRHGHV